MSGERNFDAQLGTLTDEARRAEAIRARQQRQDRRLAAALSGTFAGTLTELAETQSPVTILTRTGATIRGQITSLGPDAVVVKITERTHTVLRRLAIEGIREPGEGHRRAVEPIEEGPELAEILDEFGNRQERLAFTMSTGNRMMGHIVNVGIDQVTITLDGEGDTMTVPLFAIDQVAVTP